MGATAAGASQGTTTGASPLPAPGSTTTVLDSGARGNETKPVPAPIPDSHVPRAGRDSGPVRTPLEISNQPPVVARPTDGDLKETPPLSQRAADSLDLVRIEAQAKGLARTRGCKTSDQCRNAPVGVKACGGPRYYLKYCAATTDSAALFRKLAELAKAERAYNKKYNVMSTCIAIVPSPPKLQGGTCM